MRLTRTSLLVAITTTLFGQIYLRPFYTDFRFSMGVVVIGLFLLLYDLKPVDLVFTTFTIFICRYLIALQNDFSPLTGFLSHYPSAMYYLLFSLTLLGLNIKNKLKNPVGAFLILFFADSCSNWFELILRGDLDQYTFFLKVQPILLTAIIRATLILLAFFLIKFYPEMFEKEAEKRKMASLILNQSKLYGEVTFIRKSEEDIEKAMMKAYSLYRDTRENEENLPRTMDIPRKVLSISRDVHEIKKDYRRIRQALTALIPNDFPKHSITPNELIQYLCDDLEALALSQNKTIRLRTYFEAEFPEKNLYDCISLINNLLVNAIEAIDESGEVALTFKESTNQWHIEVEDTGSGISEDDLLLIFDPGYSTKYDPLTGTMSTGIGLAQVQYIVSHIIKGKLEVHSTLGSGTKMTVTFPKNIHTNFGGTL